MFTLNCVYTRRDWETRSYPCFQVKLCLQTVVHPDRTRLMVPVMMGIQVFKVQVNKAVLYILSEQKYTVHVSWHHIQ